MTALVTSAVVAIGRESWEAELVAALNSGASGLTLVRRCIDAVDLGAVAVGGLAEVAIVGARLPRLDLGVIDSVHGAGVHLIGVAADDAAANRLRNVGISRVVVIADQSIDDVVHVLAAVAGEARVQAPVGADSDGIAFTPTLPAADRVDGRLTVVVGPTGAPGRTTIATNLAALSSQTANTLLIDADTDAPIVASLLGLLVDEPGLSRAVRTASDLTRDGDPLAQACRTFRPWLDVLSGATIADNPDVVRASALERVMVSALRSYSHVVVDTPAWTPARLMQGQGTAQPLRALLSLADDLVVVGSADPLGIVRLLGVLHLTEAEAPQASHAVVLNRARRSALGGADTDVLDLLRQHVALPSAFIVPEDQVAVDAAVLSAQPFALSQPKSKAARALHPLANQLASQLGMPSATQVAPSRLLSMARSRGDQRRLSRTPWPSR